MPNPKSVSTSNETSRKKRPSYEVRGRDYFLRDINEDMLERLTEVLCMPEDVSPGKPPKWWLDDQRNLISDLDLRLRKPRDLLSRAAMALGKQKIRYFPEPAPLCALHAELDPRVVHNLMLMVANECTLRSDKYRHACRYATPESDHVLLPMEAEAWVDRLDRVTAMRLGGPHEFDQLLGYMPKISLSRRMRGCTCEACLLGYIGGNASILADLWVSVKLRENAYKTHHRGREPRLGRIIEAWCSHHDAASVKHIESVRDKLLPHLEEARARIVEHQRIQDVSTRRAGKHSQKHKHSGHKHRSRSTKQWQQKHGTPSHSSSSSRPHKSSPTRRGEHADTKAHPQSDREMIGKGTTSSRGTSTASRMTDWPSPFEFQVIEDQGEAVDTSAPYSPRSNDGDEDDENMPVSPLTNDGDHNRDRFENQLAPLDGQNPHRCGLVDEADIYDEYNEDDEEEAAAEAWFKYRSERVNLAQALPAFSAFNAPSAVPESLHPVPHHATAPAADDAASWYSATVHTYVPKRGPPEPMPRPPSSHYTFVPKSGRYSTAEAALHRDPPVPWEQWERRFVHDETLARLEGR